ncbi:helix-turn-helix transcriptional regulator [Variovorax sp. VNK109]|uniref:helix-turn-helix transcriptional regulator n=1 Tax=Variovorax sp. VNK109 TaxID=3400919 RepID=UPI003C0D0E65
MKPRNFNQATSQSDTKSTTTPIRYIRLPEVRQMVPLSRATIWRKSKDGSFPRPVKLSQGITAWSVLAIEQWIADKEGK